MKEVRIDYKQLYLEELKRNYELVNQLLSNIDTISCQNNEIERLKRDISKLEDVKKEVKLSLFHNLKVEENIPKPFKCKYV